MSTCAVTMTSGGNGSASQRTLSEHTVSERFKPDPINFAVDVAGKCPEPVFEERLNPKFKLTGSAHHVLVFRDLALVGSLIAEIRADKVPPGPRGKVGR
jgi:hypothetical protein